MSAHPTQLFALLFNEGKLDQLAAALSQTRQRMDAAGEGNLWRFWCALELACRGEFIAAENLVLSLTGDLAVEAQRVVVIQRAKRQGDWSQAVEFFDKRWRETLAPAELLNLCEAQLNAGNASFVLEHGNELVDSLGTPDSLRLAITGAVRKKEWRRCLDLLAKYLGVFANRQLPVDLRRLNVTCEQNLGMLTEAVRHAEELVKEDTDTENIALLFHLRVTTGQLKEATLPAKELVQNPNTSIETLMQVSWAMRLEDRAIAEAALRKAVERGVSGPQLVSMATLLAHELPTHDLLPVLLPKMNEEALKPNPFLHLADINEMVKLQNVGQEHAKEALTLFRAGKLPVHALSLALHWPLASWPILAVSAQDDPGFLTSHLPVLFRHGGRPSIPEQRKIQKLVLDITAFTNAHELGLLPMVEKVYGPLAIPPALRTSLVQQLDEANRNQPNVIEARTVVLRLVDRKQIEVWTPPDAAKAEPIWREGIHREWWMAIEEMRRRKGQLIDAWPKLQNSGGNFVPPEEITSQLTTLTTVTTKLRQLGKISESQLRTANSQFAAISHGVEGPELRTGQPLFLEGHIAETLAEEKLLEPLAKAFALIMSDGDVGQIRAEERSSHWRGKVAVGINAMLQRLRTSNAYTDLVLQGESNMTAERQQLDATMTCLEQLLQSKAGGGHWVWIDDRYLNAFDQCGQIPTITTLGIIEELRRGGHLSIENYFDYRHRLRAADFRYIPFSEEEVLFHLKHAEIQNNQIVETPELTVLRRYLARAILDRGTLQMPPLDFSTPKPAGETDFLVSVVSTVSEALVKSFSDLEPDETIQRTRASWMLQSLWCTPEHFAIMVNPMFENHKAKEARGAGDLMLLGKALNPNAFGSTTSMKRYVRWLEQNVLLDSSRQVLAAEQVKATLEGQILRNTGDGLQRHAFVEVLRRWYLALPNSIRQRVQLNRSTRQALHFAKRQVVTVAEAQFDAERLWKAAERVYKGGDTTLTSLDRIATFVLRIKRKEGSLKLLLCQKNQETHWAIEDDIVGLLDSAAFRRRDILKRHPEWFDCAGTSLERQVARVIAMSPGSKRILTVDKARKLSVWNYYCTLEQLCRSGIGPTIEQMKPPEPSRLGSFLRWRDGEDIQQSDADCESIGDRLVNAVGLMEAFKRLSLIPRNLPASFLKAFDSKSLTIRRKFVETLKSALSPLVVTHILRLKLRLKYPSSETWDLAESLIGEPMHVEARALLQLVRWSWSHLGDYAWQSRLGPTSRLAFAWVHGGKLFEILRSVSTADDVCKFFTRFDYLSISEFIESVDGEDDCAFPRNVTPRILIVTATASAIRAESANISIIPESIQRASEESCMERKDTLMWPKVDWLYDQEVFGNSLRSFFGERREQLLAPLLGPSAASLFSSIEIRKQLDALVTSLEENANLESSWALLGVILRGQSCPPPLRARLRNLMERIDFMALPFTEQSRYAVVLALSVQAWPLGGEELSKRWQEVIVSFAKSLGQQYSIDGDIERRQQMVLRCVQALTRHNRGTTAVEIFVSTVLAGWRQWDEFGPALAQFLPLLLSLPEGQLSAIWPLILCIRRDGTLPGIQRVDASVNKNHQEPA